MKSPLKGSHQKNGGLSWRGTSPPASAVIRFFGFYGTTGLCEERYQNSSKPSSARSKPAFFMQS